MEALKSIQLGNGFNSKKGTFLDFSAFKSLKPYSVNPGAVGNFEFKADMIESVSTFIEEQHFSVNVSARNLAYNVSAGININSFKKENKLSVTWYIKSEQLMDIIALEDKEMSADAKKTFDTARPTFISSYGDQFISRIHLGRKIILVYTYEATDKTDKENFQQKMKFAISNLNAKVGVDQSFTREVSQYFLNKRITFLSLGAGDGDGISDINFTDISNLSSALKEFLKKFESSSNSVIGYEVATYQGMNNLDSENYLSFKYIDCYFSVNKELQSLKIELQNESLNKKQKELITLQIEEREIFLIKLTDAAKKLFGNSDKMDSKIAFIKLSNTVFAPLELPSDCLSSCSSIWTTDIAYRAVQLVYEGKCDLGEFIGKVIVHFTGKVSCALPNNIHWFNYTLNVIQILDDGDEVIIGVITNDILRAHEKIGKSSHDFDFSSSALEIPVSKIFKLKVILLKSTFAWNEKESPIAITINQDSKLRIEIEN